MNTLQVNSIHNKRDPSMPRNYSALTSHQLRQPKGNKSTPVVPKVGDVFKLEINLVTKEDEDATPMAKIRFFEQERTWTMVNKTTAGMYVFFNSEPTAEHKHFRITSIIPSGTGCYAEPIE